jgi:hypothetical protein
MNRKAKKILAFIITLLIMTAVPAVALATDVSVTADSTEVKAGDTVTLTVIVTADHIGVASGSFTYDPALLTYISSDGGASDGYINMVSAQKGGSSSLSAVIKFTAKAKGTGVVNVSIDNVLGYDEQALEKGTGEVTITIAAADAPPPASSVEESVPPVDLSQTGVAAQNVTGAEAQMYVWRDLSSLTLPSGFADKQVTYAGEQVGGAAMPGSDDINLLYLSEAAGGNAGYYIYNEQKNMLDPYITITSERASFTIIWPDQTVAAPAGFEKATLEWDDKSLPAWKAPESGDIVYLVYARNSKGEAGFYLFNTEDESVQRYAAVPEQGVAPSAELTSKPVSGQATGIKDYSGITIDRTLFIVLCIAAALILVALAVFTTLYMKRIRSSSRRVMRMKERMEAEAKEKQASGAPPAPQAKELEAPAAVQAPSPSETKNKREATVPETKEKPASIVKDADLSDYPKGKDT